jgi:multisubunit Na+/H+ antiporter MnhE subunit
MPEMIAGMCIAIVVLGTIYSSFGLQWSKLRKRLYWIVGLILAYGLITTAIDMYSIIISKE